MGIDGQRCPGLGQQLQRAVEDGVVENGLVQFRLVHVWLGRHYRAGCCDYSRSDTCHCGGCRRFGEIDEGVGFVFEGCGLSCIELEHGFQFIQEATLGIVLAPIGIADTHRHFIGELAVLGLGQCGSSAAQADALEQHVLIQT